MSIRIALAGNPNSGKTTLFNALTGSNQFVGNWPGVTVEKKEGRLKKRDGVIVTDLPGIYSLSPYTMEEVVARKYLVNERPDVILNLVDGTNIERNLYLTTQLTELGIPVVIAINMMDIVRKNGDEIDISVLSRQIGCPVVEISALKGDGINEAAEAAIRAAESGNALPQHNFSGAVEHAIAHIEEAAVHSLPEEQQRWYAIKIFERDERVLEKLAIPAETMAHIEKDIVAAEKELDDDAESIITNERYGYIEGVIRACYKKKSAGQLTVSDKIDRVVTNRFAALPIFAAIMFLVYYIAVSTVGTWVTDFTNDGLFGDGFYLFGIGRDAYEEDAGKYGAAAGVIAGALEYAEKDLGLNVDALREKLDHEAEGFDKNVAKSAAASLAALVPDRYTYTVVNEEDLTETSATATKAELLYSIEVAESFGFASPDPAADYGVWVPGVPVLIGNGLTKANAPTWLHGLILDGIVAGVGGVLGFVPQILVLFIMLAFLEACGYMARIAFVLDRIFRKFGLSGKSFIPVLIGTGCGVPGIMASRTIENQSDRRMTIMTTTFIPCGAKLPFIALMAGAVFGGAWWVAPVAYFLGMLAIVASGIMLKKTKPFAGEPSPFVMELPAYHLPTPGNVLRSMWERGWSFIKKAGTVILLFTIVLWFLTYFGFTETGFRMLGEEEVGMSMLAAVGNAIAWIFAPLGFGTWQGAVATITGLVAKENIVATLNIVYGDIGTIGAAFSMASGFSFLIFNLLCAPCFAAMGAIRREMNNWKWTAFAILYECGFAYAISLIVYQVARFFVSGFGGAGHVVGLVCSVILVAFMVYMLICREDNNLFNRKKKAAVNV